MLKCLLIVSLLGFCFHPAFADQIDDAKSKIELGTALEFGSAGHKNPVVSRQLYDDAAKLLKPLAEQGNVDAQFELGMMYLHGQAVPQIKRGERVWDDPDYVDAMTWFRKAADQDNRQAQMKMSELYLSGSAGKQDLMEAYFWRSLAMRPKDAGDLFLDYPVAGTEAHQYLTPEQKSEVKKRIDKWEWDVMVESKRKNVHPAMPMAAPAANQ